MSGPFGFQDWQRHSGWDSSLFVASSNLVVPPGGYTSGRLDMRQWERIAGSMKSPTNLVQVSFNWYASPTAVQSIASRTMLVRPETIGLCAFSLPNWGPFLEVTVGAAGAVGFTLYAYLFGTNRTPESEFVPQGPDLINQHAAPIGAAATITLHPTFYAGRVHVWFFGTLSMTVIVRRYLDLAGTVGYVEEYTALPAATDEHFELVVPPGSWWIDVQNPGAATTYYLTAMPSYGANT